MDLGHLERGAWGPGALAAGVAALKIRTELLPQDHHYLACNYSTLAAIAILYALLIAYVEFSLF